MFLYEILVFWLTAKFQPDSDKIFKQLFSREIEISGSRKAGGVESLEPRAKAPGQGSAVELRMFVESVNSHRLRTQQSSYSTKLREKFVVWNIAMMDFKLEAHM